MANRLAAATSPYLLQHADNPVDWFEWGDEAFDEARRRDVPVLLSVGYAACHWCHVMAHESFEDDATAELMNRLYVNIKVDREERPDIDAVYMTALQAMSGHGGWPMTVFLTPSAEPFYAGTYFPPVARQGSPSFGQVLTAVSDTWMQRRDDVTQAATEAVRRLEEMRQGVSDGVAPPSDEELAGALETLGHQFDERFAGFGGAPKFPPSMTLEHLLRHHGRTGSPEALEMAQRTFAAMARGGIYDQLAGGFARYSVDRQWIVPHFEKMLYDNALLIRAYAHWWRSTQAPLAKRVVEDSVEFLLAELRTEQGAFASALDADSEGVEGKFYVWTRAEFIEVLGEVDGEWAADLLSVTDDGTFEHGSSVLQMHHDPSDGERWARVRRQLLESRSQRVRPARDDKIVAAWNGLAIAALAEAGALFDRPEWIEAAAAAADLLLAVHLGAGEHPDRLVRVSRDGVAGRHAGVLEDHACVADGLLALYSVTDDESWLTVAGVLLDVVMAHFTDGQAWMDTADDQSNLIVRPSDPTDNASPSGRSAAGMALLTYAALTGSTVHRAAAESALGSAAQLATSAPRFTGWGLAAAEALADGPLQVAVVGPAGLATDELRRAALMTSRPGAVVGVGDPAQPQSVGLLQDRPMVEGKPTAYVCRGFVCDRPVTAVADLAALLEI